MAAEEWDAKLQQGGLGLSVVRRVRQVLNSILQLPVEAGWGERGGSAAGRSSSGHAVFAATARRLRELPLRLG